MDEPVVRFTGYLDESSDPMFRPLSLGPLSVELALKAGPVLLIVSALHVLCTRVASCMRVHLKRTVSTMIEQP